MSTLRHSRLVPALAAALLAAATLAAWLGYRNPQLMVWLADMPFCR